MNQQLLINDDLICNIEKQVWSVSALISGQHVYCEVPFTLLPDHAAQQTLTSALRFDIEALLEDWFDEHELESDRIIIT